MLHQLLNHVSNYSHSPHPFFEFIIRNSFEIMLNYLSFKNPFQINYDIILKNINIQLCWKHDFTIIIQTVDQLMSETIVQSLFKSFYKYLLTRFFTSFLKCLSDPFLIIFKTGLKSFSNSPHQMNGMTWGIKKCFMFGNKALAIVTWVSLR